LQVGWSPLYQFTIGGNKLGTKIKAMGSADVRRIDKGETWGGRLGTPLESALVFSKENHWVIDSDEAGISQTAVDLLLEDKEGFKDVTGLERVPTNLNQQLFQAMPKSEKAEVDPATAEGAQTAGPDAIGNEGAGTTTTGGSTPKARTR